MEMLVLKRLHVEPPGGVCETLLWADAGVTHHTLINQNEDKACGRYCMEYSEINLTKCRIYGEVNAYDIYIADVQIDRFSITLSFVNIITLFIYLFIFLLLSQCANPQKLGVRISIYLESKHVKPPVGITKSTCSECELT